MYGTIYFYYLRQVGHVHPRDLSVCLFVCLQHHVKTTDGIIVKILPGMYIWTRKH